MRYQAGKKKKPLEPKLQPVSSMLTTTFGGDVLDSVQTMNLRLHNTTAHRLEVLLRGPESHDLPLEARAVQELDVTPGEYLVGVYAPDNCHVHPVRGSWLIRAWAPLSVRLASA